MRLFLCPPSVRAFSFLETQTQLQQTFRTNSGATVELFRSIASLLADLSTALVQFAAIIMVIKSLIKPSKKSRKRK
jgi:hypothetical protein